MKKLFAFLLGLNASLGALAYNNPSGFSGVSFQDIGSDTQFIEMTTAGSLSTWAQNETELGYMGQTSRTKLVITGPMSASDFTALSGSAWDSFTTVDLSKVTVTDPTYISNMTLANAQTIILPNGLTKAQIASLKNEASGVVAGLVGTSETAYNDHYYYTLLPGETEQEYTGTVYGSEGNYYFHETKTYQRPLTIQDGYPTFTWTDLLGETHNLSKEQAENAENGSWIPENVDVPLQKSTKYSYSYNYTYNGETYSYTIPDHQLQYINTVSDGFQGTETTVKTDFDTWTGITNITIHQNDPISVSSSPVYKFQHLEHTYEHWIDYPATVDNVSYDEINDRYIGTLVNGGTVQDQWGYTVNYGTAKFPISSNYKYDYTDIRNNPLQYPAEGTLSDADEDGFVDWVFDEDVALRKVQIPYNNLTEVEGMVAYVNTAGSLSNVASVFYDSDLASAYRSSENITVLGNISNADLTELGESNFASVNFLDMSGAVLTGDVTTLSSKGTAAIVLPNIQDGDEVRTVSTAEMGTLQQRKMPNDNNYYNFKCLAYLDDAAYQSSGNDHKVCVYTTQCSSLTNLSSFINTNSSLVFLPLYKTDGTLDNYMLQYNTEIANLLTYVKDLPALNIDFGMVYVGLSTDFSQLNSATHYITIPVNGAYDFTNETDAYDNDGNKYVYGDNIYVVATYKNPEGIYAKTCMYAGKSFTATEPTTITYVRNAGTLSGASGAVSEEMLTSTRMIFVGNLNASDVSAMHMMGATTLDFVDATVADNDIQAFANDNVKYLALPDNANADINATSTDVCTYSTSCPSLLCVGAYNTTTNTLTTWSSAPGNVYKVTSLIRPQKTNRGTGLMCASLENVVMSGALNWDDISANNQNGKDNGLEGATTIKSANMEFAYFPTNSDMVFSTAAWGSIEEITLPNNPKQTEIPALCLDNCKKLEATICIPYYYTKIGTNAFNNLPMTHVTATDAEGNVIDYGNKTFTLPAKLELIQAGAFWTSDETISDVYILATKAPKCEANAFSAGGLYGWGGFGGNNTHPMCREVYWNNTKQFAMLHFPSDVTSEDAKKYTDVTRDYTLWDETGAYDGQGNLRVWPNFSEIYRAYNQAVDGVTWDAWDLTRSKTNPNDIPCWPTSYKDANGATVTVSNTYYAGVLIPASTTPATSTEANGYVYDTDYMGWHQFVLADYYRYKEIVIEEADSYEDGEWYTLCIPFDMTEDEVIRVMGVPASTTTSTHTYTGGGHQISENSTSSNKGAYLPTVYSLKTVTRQNPKVTLGFSQELMNQIVENGKNLVFNDNGTIRLGNDTYSNANKEGKILIRGGYPYLVRPIFPSDFNEASNVKGNLGRYILSVSEFKANDRGKDAILGEGSTTVTMPIITQKVKAIDTNGAVVTYSEDVYEKDADGNNTSVLIGKQGDPYYYFFQGTFTKQMLPQSYILTNSVTGPDNKWHRVSTAGTREWDSYTAIVGSNTTVNGAAYYTASGTTAETGDDFSTWYVKMTSHKDDFIHSGSNDVKYEITFENEDGFDEVVAIDKIDGKDLNNSILNSPVYNMAGQRIANSMEGLNKGLYIVNGKKVLVK